MDLIDTIFRSSLLWIGMGLVWAFILCLAYSVLWHPVESPAPGSDRLLLRLFWLVSVPGLILTFIGIGVGIARYFRWIN
jgi:hypothetical protein